MSGSSKEPGAGGVCPEPPFQGAANAPARWYCSRRIAEISEGGLRETVRLSGRAPSRCSVNHSARAEPTTQLSSQWPQITTQFVFPDAQDPPAALPEGAIDKSVAGLVRVKFPVPKIAILSRGGVMSRAPMPETAIDKHRDPPLGEQKIRVAEQGPVPSPTADEQFAKQGGQPTLRPLVATSTNPGHDLRAFLNGKDIGHGDYSGTADSKSISCWIFLSPIPLMATSRFQSSRT